MKKLLLIFIAVATVFTVGTTKAQSQVTNLVSQYSLSVDTVTNTATKYLSYASAISGYKKIITIQFQAVEISGTTAGTAQAQGSLDGTNWYNLGTAFTLTDVASQVTSITLTDWGSLYLRLAVTGSGTMSDKIYAKFLVRTP